MKQEIIIPVTSADFQELEVEILENNDEFCSYCDGELETNNEALFSAGIFYICKQCGKKFKKTKYRDFGTGGNHFVLKEIRG